METIPYHPLIQVTQEDMRKAREFYGLNDVTSIRESLKVLEEWCLKQEHLVEKNINKTVLERLFILARGSVEGTKTRIDKICTYRGMMPELTLHRSPTEFDKFWDCVFYVPLPKLCPSDQSRVMLTQFNSEHLDDFTLLTYFRYCFLIGEYRVHYDYGVCERYVVDLKNISTSLISKLNPVIIKKAEVLCTEGFGTKINGIHILNAPKFIDKLIFILKQALREKVAKRIHVHNSYEDFYKHIPKNILPLDYGGDLQSMSKLQAEWKEELRSPEAQEIIKNCDKLVTDESKRSSNKFNEEYLGMPGTFRRLNVD